MDGVILRGGKDSTSFGGVIQEEFHERDHRLHKPDP